LICNHLFGLTRFARPRNNV